MAYHRDFGKIKRPGFFARQTITNLLILINVAAFFIIFFLARLGSLPLETIAMLPENIFEGKTVWTIFTSIFAHVSFFHIFVNMFSLFFIGNLVERIVGRKRYLWLYLVSGIVASLFFVLLAYGGQFIPRGDYLFGSVDIPALGASGAIFGLLGLLAVLLPKKEVYLIVGPLIVIVLQFFIGSLIPSISNAVDIIATILVFVMIFSIFSFNSRMRKFAMPLRLPFWLAPVIAIVPLVIIGLFVKLPIGNSAHFGGLVAGLIYGAYLRNKYSKKVKLLNKMVR